ncbi:ABC transporter permease [Lederbergia wuyishanensis]|uniref:Aldouronate transport system permease protein n=1 Tax=Lederbergia wuyishanensis TaxID=1347903 RepID=A0ABU0D342_9BACI|nr:ABC transporter permease subunit [Lederbergia wuyishanensis]MCJ8008009.1 ABC transporter permease subunit [Lederbergia wuyishanensis]MDQ0342820.1 putative aldouronate transport system permease protein [Lederbergia wuyishanensis]
MKLNRTLNTSPLPSTLEVNKRQKLFKDFARDKYLYLLLLPGLIYLIIFKYFPMYGVIIAFKEFNMFSGIMDSPWVGLEQFERLFRTPDFQKIFINTLVISVLKLVFGFPAPIILALLLNELRHMFFKRFTQSILYLPHFVSWVIFAGIIITFLNPVDGLINHIIQYFGGKPIHFLTSKAHFRSILVITDIYKEMGWGTIIYLAAMTGVNPDLYEASRIDGANKFKQMWHVTLPSIRPVILIMLILNLGNILEAGFFQIYLLYSPLVYDVADIIDTYVYRRGIQEANYSLATAAGLFKSLIALALIVTANKIVKKFGEDGLW